MRDARMMALALGISSAMACGSDSMTTPGSPSSGANPTPTPAVRATPANQPPTVLIHAAQPERGIWRVTEIAFAATATDPDGDALEYTWDYGDGTVEKTGAGASHAFDTAGDVEVTLTVDDKRGGKATARRTVHILKMTGRWLGILTNGPQAGLRLNGDVVQGGSGPGFSGTMNSQNGNGTGDIVPVSVSGRFISPRDMRFTVPICGDATYTGSWNEDFTAFDGSGPGCGNSFKRLELFR